MSLMTLPRTDASLLALGDIMEQRIALLRHLADSLGASQTALVSRDAETVARGAAHQAELCRHWSVLEEQLRREAVPNSGSHESLDQDSPRARRCLELQTEFTALETRIRYLTRVHVSLLRHMQRSAAVLARIIESCAVTYSPESGPVSIAAQPRVGE